MASIGELNYSYRDLYPGMDWGLTDETSNLAQPESDDKEALNEDLSSAETAAKDTTGKSVLVALGLFVALIVFFGVK